MYFLKIFLIFLFLHFIYLFTIIIIFAWCINFLWKFIQIEYWKADPFSKIKAHRLKENCSERSNVCERSDCYRSMEGSLYKKFHRISFKEV